MTNTRKVFHATQLKFAELGGWATILTEIKKEFDLTSLGNIDLAKFVTKKEREFWEKSTPLATKLCNLNIKMAEEYMEGEKK